MFKIVLEFILYVVYFYFSDVLNNEEKNVYAQYVLGICLYFQDIDKAFEHFQQILELDLLFPRALRIYVVTNT